MLCGHSAGGSVVTVVADRVPERVAALVYLDAVVPADGQSLFEFMGEGTAVPALFRAMAAEHGDGWRIPAGAPFDATAFGVTDARDRAWVDRRLTDHPLAAFEDRLSLTGGAAQVPRTYIRCEALTWPSVSL